LTDLSTTAFHDLPLDPRLLRALDDLGFSLATPIQAASLAPLLAGRDLLAQARTGSGKTGAFALPLLQRAADGGSPPRALVLAPTRELAQQIAAAIKDFAAHLQLSVATICGGNPYPAQIRALAAATVVVGTPGRLRDHLERGTLDLSAVQTVVLDEADRMFHMGLVDDMLRLVDATPAQRQLVLFSATLPPEIHQLAARYLRDPAVIQLDPEASSVDHLTHTWTLVPRQHTHDALALLLHAVPRGSALVFSQTRAGAAEAADDLRSRGFRAAALHGELDQREREQVLQQLRDGSIDVLVATDVAARGLDVDRITHVVNLELPDTTESYIHRVGRTGRMGRGGTAITFATSKGKRGLHELGEQLRHPLTPIDLPVPAGTARPEWARSAAQFGRPPPARPTDLDEMKLRADVGRKQRVRASDLVGLLTKEAGVRGIDIGKVEIGAEQSLIAVPRRVGAHVLERFPRGVLHGHALQFTAAEADAEIEPGPWG
jgi:ATP-dependent RNA helicase DeaD